MLTDSGIELLTSEYEKDFSDFTNNSNFENACFVFALSKYLNFSLKKIIKVLNNFKGLKFRQQIIYNSKKVISSGKFVSFI